MSESSSEKNTRTLSSKSPLKHATWSAVGNVKTLEKKCWICNEIRTVDEEAYQDGGLARIRREDNTDKIEERKKIFIVNNKKVASLRLPKDLIFY